MKKTIRLNENDLIKLISKIISEQTITQGEGSDPYQYKEEGGKYFFAKKGSENWTEAKSSGAVDSIKSKYFSDSSKMGSSKIGGSSFDKGKKLGSAHKKAAIEFVKDATEVVVKIGKVTIKVITYAAVGTVVVLYNVFYKIPAELGKALLSFLGALAKKTGEIIVSGVKKGVKIGKDLLSKAISATTTLFKKIFEAISSLGTKVYAVALALASKIGVIWNTIKGWAVGAFNKVKQVLGAAWDEVTGAVDAVTGYVTGWLTEGELDTMVEWYHYYKSLPQNKMISEIYKDTRKLI
jgi:hypothetical protein